MKEAIKINNLEEFVYMMQFIDELYDNEYTIAYKNEYGIYTIGNWCPSKEFVNKEGYYIGDKYLTNKFGIKKNNPVFIHYLKQLNNISDNFYYYRKDITYSYENTKSKLKCYGKFNEYKELADEYLGKLEDIKNRYIERYNKSRLMVREYEKELVKPTKWNKFCNKRIDIFYCLSIALFIPIFTYLTFVETPLYLSIVLLNTLLMFIISEGTLNYNIKEEW